MEAISQATWERSEAEDGTTRISGAEPQTPALDLILLLAARRRLLVTVTLLAMVLGAIIAFSTKPTYTAIATIMPPQAPQSSLSSLMGQLGSLTNLNGAGGLLKNPSDLYVGVLQSRTIADRAIAHFDLQQRWHARTMVTARKALANHALFESAKNGMIQISVTEHDPGLASNLANFFVDALYEMNSTLAISEASQRRLFFEQQLNDEKRALSAAEEDLKSTEQKTGLLSLAGQTELVVRNIAQMRAQISAYEVKLQALRTYDSEENPDVIRLQQEISTMRAQLVQLQNSPKRLSPGDTDITATQVPGGSLEYARKLREVKYHDTLLDLLSRQYEAARIDEAKSAPIIQAVDRSVPPDQKSGPPRILITLSSGIIGFLLAAAFVFLRGLLERAERNTVVASKLNQLRTLLPRTPFPRFSRR